MFKRHYLSIIFLVTMLNACDNSSTNSTSRQSNESQNPTIPTKEAIDNNFNDFINKFSTDSIFQVSRIKFPLKIKWYDIDNNRDSIIYKNIESFELMDFRKKKSTGQYDQWEQNIFVDKNNTSATIEIRGIENGIMVDYLFEKIKGVWMLIEIDDRST